jgi:hypothetical protein
VSRGSVFLRIAIVFAFCGSLYCFGGVIRSWGQHALVDPPCVDVIGFNACSKSEEQACKRPDQVLTWQPANPTGFVYRCTCPHPAAK